MSIDLQKLASIPPRTSPIKFARSPCADPPGALQCCSGLLVDCTRKVIITGPASRPSGSVHGVRLGSNLDPGVPSIAVELSRCTAPDDRRPFQDFHLCRLLYIPKSERHSEFGIVALLFVVILPKFGFYRTLRAARLHELTDLVDL